MRAPRLTQVSLPARDFIGGSELRFDTPVGQEGVKRDGSAADGKTADDGRKEVRKRRALGRPVAPIIVNSLSTDSGTGSGGSRVEIRGFGDTLDRS